LKFNEPRNRFLLVYRFPQKPAAAAAAFLSERSISSHRIIITFGPSADHGATSSRASRTGWPMAARVTGRRDQWQRAPVRCWCCCCFRRARTRRPSKYGVYHHAGLWKRSQVPRLRHECWPRTTITPRALLLLSSRNHAISPIDGRCCAIRRRRPCLVSKVLLFSFRRSLLRRDVIPGRLFFVVFYRAPGERCATVAGP